jgi:arabinofuranosyltransferase
VCDLILTLTLTLTKLAFVVPALVALLARLLTGPHPIDDAYITFRYARNLAEGLGLVYNPGEWVLGTTTPLWAILLASGYRLGFTDLPWLANALSAVCDAASAGLLVHYGFRIGWRLPGAVLAGLAWALNPMSIAFATGGMETSLFVLAALVALGLTANGSSVWLAAGLSGLAMLVRPEGALLVATVVGWTWLNQRREVWQAVLAGSAPALIAGLAIFWRYGSPLPNSVAAKQVAYQSAWPFENAVALVVQAGLPGWSTYLLAALPAALGLVVAALGVFALVDLIRRALPWLHRQGVPWQPFASFASLYLVFYVVVGLRGVRLFPWYLVPIEPFYLLGAAAGLARVGAWRTQWVAGILVLWQLAAIDWRQPMLPAGEHLGREQLMLDIGRGLAESLPATAVVAAPEIGALGYASNLHILDTVGLVSPVALRYYPLLPDQLVTDNAIPPQLIVDQRPDVVVTLDAFAQRSLLPDAAFESAYRLERSYPAPIWQSEELLLFRRNDTVGP